MPISAYETTFGKHYDMREIGSRIETQIVTNPAGFNRVFDYPQLRESVTTPGWLYGITDAANNIPPFVHPITLNGTARNAKERLIVVDMRPFTRVTREGASYISSKEDFDFALLRAGLQHYSLENNVSDLQAIGNFPMGVYVRWISEVISRKLGLNPSEQMRIAILTGALYNSMFKDTGDRPTYNNLDEREKTRIAQSISKSTMIAAQTVFDVLDNLNMPIYDLASFCEALAAQTDIVRLERFNLGLLQQLTGGSWWGLNSREILAVALEHAPTFFTILYTALTSKTYKKAHITTVVETINKRGLGDDWLRGLLSLPDVVPVYSRNK